MSGVPLTLRAIRNRKEHEAWIFCFKILQTKGGRWKGEGSCKGEETAKVEEAGKLKEAAEAAGNDSDPEYKRVLCLAGYDGHFSDNRDAELFKKLGRGRYDSSDDEDEEDEDEDEEDEEDEDEDGEEDGEEEDEDSEDGEDSSEDSSSNIN
uniref:Acidic leucine-rich nuclear phosphoprotein 32 family member B-like n=1 Tax=Cicer arietinum TaxID=3827 RepID=A0A3Q7YBD7_CICAR|nr:acidic leucine-rich nuclear phosphoprotein 32 family member B-like [Cicer arietinum]